MKFFIDTANFSEIKKIIDVFPIDGVTTNPTLISQTGESIQSLIPKICELVQKPVSAEVIETEKDKMYQEALQLSKLHKNVVVKLPLTKDGLAVCRLLKEKEIPTNVTLCFSPLQALRAAQSGATMVSIFVGRLDDIDQSGMQVVADTLEIFSNYSLKTEVLVASIRHQKHILDSALLGTDIVTAPYKVLNQIIQHPLTDIGLKKFLESAQALQKK
ncbi:MAG: fructose-6-phosphate aldolase [Bdellovibrionales bacterium]|nr:fructose-6-phosphate aldolase [Bdellovibrionales bacterium]